MKKMRRVALRENKMQIATGQRENPETVDTQRFQGGTPDWIRTSGLQSRSLTW